MENKPKEEWDMIIMPRKFYIDFRLSQLYYYKDLLYLYIKKEVALQYKQTILGPIWFILQPILTTILFVFVFGKIAKISPEGIPQPLFYMSGIIIWNFFSDCFNKTSDTFTQNASIFGKVYFPRLIIPISIIISNLLKFFIQLILFLFLYTYFYLNDQTYLHANYYIIFIPLLVFIMGTLGLGGGLVFSSLTTKYKDLKFLIQFGIQLLMYITPIIYPLSLIAEEKRTLILLNPISPVVEAFKFAFYGSGTFNFIWIIYSFTFAFILLFIGLAVFNKTEETFMDIV